MMYLLVSLERGTNIIEVTMMYYIKNIIIPISFFFIVIMLITVSAGNFTADKDSNSVQKIMAEYNNDYDAVVSRDKYDDYYTVEVVEHDDYKTVTICNKATQYKITFDLLPDFSYHLHRKIIPFS